LIVDETDWRKRGKEVDSDRIVKLRVLYTEREIREVIKRSGGYWDREMRVWKLRYREVRRLGLEGRVTE
jgi:hypothetical protein